MSVVVVVFEVLDHHPRFEQASPVISVQALLPQPIVERFDVSVVPRRPRRDVGDTDTVSAELLQHMGNELRTVVHPQHLRPTARTSCRARR